MLVARGQAAPVGRPRLPRPIARVTWIHTSMMPLVLAIEPVPIVQEEVTVV